MPPVVLALHAMATRFELVLPGENPVALRAAGEEALQEVRRLEALLSLFEPGSEVAHVNARAAREPVRVSPEVFGLLQHAQQLSQESGGTFDITIAPLVRCWGFLGGRGSLPSPEELAAARARVGMHRVHLDAKEFTVRLEREGMMLDLGALGKGYAVERAIELLREAGITSALLHGGTSTAYALGTPPEADRWTVAIEHPLSRPEARSARESIPEELASLAIVSLKDEALSVSAVRGKFFETEGHLFGHVLDPRTGQPANASLLAAVVLPSATETDALSTALLTLGPAGHDSIARLRPGMKTLLAAQAQGQLRVETRNLELHTSSRSGTGCPGPSTAT